MPHLNIKTLKLRDYRCFKTLEIDFHEKLTVLVAANGAGKTSILDAIAVAFGPFIGAFDEAVGKHFEASDIRQFKARETATHEMEYAPDGVRLDASGFIPNGQEKDLFDNTTWSRALTSPHKSRTTIKDAKELIEYGKQLQEAVRTPGNQVLLPLIAYYGTGRLWQQKKLTEQKISHTSRTIGYTDCLDPASSYKTFVKWFRYWNLAVKTTHAKSQENGKHEIHAEFDGYIQSVSKAVNICLAPVGWKDIEYSFTQDALVAHHEQFGQLPVDLLSDGIRNLIGLVADIAFRATKLNGHLGDKAAAETPGIVLIDEVDMHLHPEWQQVVLQNLIQAFPKMQFVVTTHSPQVLTSVDASCIRLIKEGIDEASGESKTVVRKVNQQTKGVASNDILLEIMGVNPTPQNIEEANWLADYIAMIDVGTHSTPEGAYLRKKLESHFGAKHPLMLDADRLIRFQAFKLRRQSSSGSGRNA